jgi:serine/threonine protein phosphatase PrpC
MLQANQIVLAGDKGQDRVSVLPDGDRLIFVVADCTGGCSGGAEAAELVIQLTRKHIGLLLSSVDYGKLLGEIDRVVSSDKIAGETTAVIVVASSAKVFGASVGDSGAWLLNGPNIDDLTQSQVRKPFVGTGAAFPVGFSRDAFGGISLVATDGLLKHASREAIASAVQKSNLPELPEVLMKLVRYTSGNLPDDIVIGLCRSI